MIPLDQMKKIAHHLTEIFTENVAKDSSSTLDMIENTPLQPIENLTSFLELTRLIFI